MANRKRQLQEQKAAKRSRADALEGFIAELQTVDTSLPLEFSERLWHNLIDKVTVYAAGRQYSASDTERREHALFFCGEQVIYGSDYFLHLLFASEKSVSSSFPLSCIPLLIHSSIQPYMP